jgi:hypothetical protein
MQRVREWQSKNLEVEPFRYFDQIGKPAQPTYKKHYAI